MDNCLENPEIKESVFLKNSKEKLGTNCLNDTPPLSK